MSSRIVLVRDALVATW